MTGKEATELSGRSETWLRNHHCAWCGQTSWLALTSGCGAVYDRCDPSKKDFGAKRTISTSTMPPEEKE